MKKLSLAVLASLLVSSAGVVRAETLPNLPEHVAARFNAATAMPDEGVAFGTLVGHVWHCQRVIDIPSRTERRRLATIVDAYTFSPRDRGLERHYTDGKKSAGVNLFSYVPGDGYSGSADKGPGLVPDEETIRFFRTKDGSWQLVIRVVSERQATFAACHAGP